MKTVLIEMDGRLGNQMFLYAFYKKMCIQYPDIHFKVDISTVYQKKYDGGLELSYVFPNLKIEKASFGEILKIEKKLTFKYRGKGSRILREVTDNINSKRRKKITESILTDSNICVSKLQDLKAKEWENIRFFSGFWQNISLYKDLISELQQDFSFREMDEAKDLKINNQISKSHSVSVHIRRGDYVGETLDILTVEYYKKIISNILEEIPDATLFFFSDDIEYIEKNFGDVKKVIVSENRNDFTNFRDLQLMSLCEYNVIANSTFSLWAALLNSNPNKKVYYPSKFTKEEEFLLNGEVLRFYTDK